jgi:hypothetical protein
MLEAEDDNEAYYDALSGDKESDQGHETESFAQIKSMEGVKDFERGIFAQLDEERKLDLSEDPEFAAGAGAGEMTKDVYTSTRNMKYKPDLTPILIDSAPTGLQNAGRVRKFPPWTRSLSRRRSPKQSSTPEPLSSCSRTWPAKPKTSKTRSPSKSHS